MKYPISIFALFFCVIAHCTAQWRVTSCEELGLDPVEPGTGLRLLEVYLEGNDEGIGGLGCWVHHHPNGRDYIVTPYSWGREPTVAKKGLISDAMDALSAARNEYTEYGTLDSHLYYIFDDIDRTTRTADGPNRLHGTAFWLIDDACWMRTGVPTNRILDGNQRKQIYAHEVGHCFVMENVPKLRENYLLNKWFDESVAELLSSQAFPLTNLEHYRSRSFDIDGAEFTQEYNAYVFWYYLLKTRGNSELVEFMNQLAPLKTKEARLQYMRDNRYDRDFHNFLYEFHQGELADSGDGSVIPKENNIEIVDDNPVTLITDDDPIPVGPILPERLTVLEMEIPANYDLKIKAPAGAGESLFLSLIAKGKNVKGWKNLERIEGSCRSETNAKVLISHLQNSQKSIELEYELEEKQGCCEGNVTVTENPSENELDGLFTFDYHIESEVGYIQNGNYQTNPMNYYVNSKDGSILFTEHWILDNFGDSDSVGFRVDAVIWLPNRQLVGYVYDTNFEQKRAITIDINQMKSDVLIEQGMWYKEFLDNAMGSGMEPAPLPSGSRWTSHSTGYAHKRPDPQDKTQTTKYSGYVSNETTGINSPLTTFGFLVGYLRDHQGKNKKLVYSKTERQNGDMIEGHLKNMERECYSFDGAGYKKMSLGGFVGSNSNLTSQEDEERSASADDYDKQLKELREQLMNCKNEACATEVGKKILSLEQQRRNEVYDREPDPSDSGKAGTEMQNSMKGIQDRITVLSKQLMDHAKRCNDLQRENYRCDGCQKEALKKCQEKSKRMGKEMEQLACQMAKLQGFGDVMEDCE